MNTCYRECASPLPTIFNCVAPKSNSKQHQCQITHAPKNFDSLTDNKQTLLYLLIEHTKLLQHTVLDLGRRTRELFNEHKLTIRFKLMATIHIK